MLADAGQTVILITHRLGSVRAADLIHVLDHGRVAESGTFEDLLSDEVEGPKVFRDLYRIQAAQYATEAPAVPFRTDAPRYRAGVNDRGCYPYQPLAARGLS